MTAYHRPERLDEALTLLDEHGFDAKVLAGGQSLIPMMSAGLAAPEHLVDVNRLPGLDTLAVVDGAWAWQHGAHAGYLQVSADNVPAIASYRKFGFETVYTYHYRGRPGAPTKSG